MVLCTSFSFFLLGWRQETIYAAVSVPDFPTLAIDDSLITPVGQAGSPQGEPGFNYVQINDGTTTNSSGGVWFNKPVSFTRSFRLEMAFLSTIRIQTVMD